jgi:type III secretion system (T3SS) inner membrane Yop/YscD-like protein/cysteine-rich secretory family protein
VLELLLVDPRSGKRRRLPIEGASATVGGDLDCDVVLSDPEVAPRHARIEKTPYGWQVMRQSPAAALTINDAAVEKAPLQAGDVLRIGPFLLTVVTADAASAAAAARPAAPPPPPPPARASAPRPAAPPRSAAPPPSRGGRVSAARVARVSAPRQAIPPAAIYGGLGLVLVIVVVAIILNGGGETTDAESQSRCRDLIAKARTAAAGGQFDDARDFVKSAESCASGDQRAALDKLSDDITAQRKRWERAKVELAALDQGLAGDLTGRTLPAVEKFLADYRDLPQLCDRAEKMRLDLCARAGAGKPAVNPEGISLPSDRTLPWCCDEARKFVAKGDFAKAKFVLASFTAKGDADKKQQGDVDAEIEKAAKEKADVILARVKELCAKERVLEALGELEDERVDPYKSTQAWWDLVEEADRVEDQVDKVVPIHARLAQRRRHAPPRPKPAAGDAKAAPSPAPAPAQDGAPPSPAPPPAPKKPDDHGGAAGAAVELRAQARLLLEQCDFAAAAQALEQALDSAGPEDAKSAIAADHERAIRPLRLADRVAELLAQRPLQNPFAVELRDGRSGKLQGSDGKLLHVIVGGATSDVAPRDLSARSLLELSGRVPLESEPQLNRAYVALAVKDDKTFFACIEKVAGDADEKEALDRALAWQRGMESVPPRGFVRVGARWLTWSEKAEEELKREVRDAVMAMAGRGGSAAGDAAHLPVSADAARARVVELAGAAPGVVLAALRERRDELKKAFESAPEQERLAKLHERLLALRDARKAALTLIFDEKRYFYPHTPANETEYRIVQQEVDRLVGAVRAIWGREGDEAPEPRCTLSSGFVDAVREIRLNRQVLHEIGAASDDVEQALEPAFCLPDGNVVHLRNLAIDEYERHRLDENHNVLAHNAGIAASDKGPAGGVTREELELLTITNSYRMMLGRRALAWNAKLGRAARSHSEWMSRNGTLSHFEDGDPTRYDPEARMAAEGYRSGAGENCSVGSSGAMAAHDGWCHSSGHHRNLLFESHTEMGDGQSGAYWTECFGGAHEYKGNLIH